jgi:hypothetical protein
MFSAFARIAAASTLLGLTLVASPASAQVSNFAWSVSSATTPAVSCVGGEALPCSGATRVSYASAPIGMGQAPFSNYPYFRQSPTISGHLDVTTANFDPNLGGNGCYTGVDGIFQVFVTRGGGQKERLAFELVITDANYCGPADSHFMTAPFAIHGENSVDPAFKSNTGATVTGSGTLALTDSVDLEAGATAGFWTGNFNGQIAIP